MADVTRQARRAERSTAVRVLGALGWTCYGFIHLIIAWLAVEVSLGEPRKQPAPQGAIAEIARQPVGSAVLVTLAVGLVGFAASQAIMAVIGFRWVTGRPTRATRKLGALGRAVFSLGLGVLAAKQLTGQRVGSSSAGQQHLTADLLRLPAGWVIVALVSAVVLVIAVATARRGVIRSFLEDLDVRCLSERARRWVERTGIVGWVAKGIAYASIGLLFAAAAISSDPHKSGGLDQALHLLAGYLVGRIALWLIAAGFVAFAVFCFAAARTHRR
ncbi:DUF1206 domain-containing protein [Saccharopolyspora sp. NPDC000359]|uniref:DUF1206 domain-containing protein n=1 Tax=Saccharopolyspora sp. NPDC000359 TaxID=3154251 RepID=UPI00332AEB01